MNTTKLSRIFILLLSTVLVTLISCTPAANNGQTFTEDSLRLTTASLKETPAPKRVIIGAENLLNDLDQIKGKRLAICANHTSLLPNGTHLVDTLHAVGMDIKMIFAPEHGFRGTADAGAQIKNGLDVKTGIPIVSLYGKNKKPSKDMLAEVDFILFDIQDVGARFYTYISTMTYLMEAAAANNKVVMVLDRPNPNGWYVDGPVLEKEFSSFVGMHEIPIVHGMTVAEYAKMVNGEKWLEGETPCLLKIVPCSNYQHSMQWSDTGLEWVAPSPNLKTEYAAYLYPMLCWYEGMPISVGRGTDTPFEHIGAPWHVGYKNSLMADSIKGFDSPSEIKLYALTMELEKFTPEPRHGALYPKFEGEACFGIRFTNRVDGKNLFMAGLSLLQNFQIERGNVGLVKPLFEPFFFKLTGSKKLAQAIEADKSPEEIYQSWQRPVGLFKAKRQKYLLYKDFD